MILFVGDKPSIKTDPNVPFKGASCEKRLNSWVNQLNDYYGCDEHEIINQISSMFVIKAYFYFERGGPIIALGNNASKALDKLDIPHFKLPHPSGRNRQINDKEFIKVKLEECRQYIKRFK